MYGYVIFTDIEKYSTLKDADLKIYFNKIIPVIFEELKVYKDAALIWNTWGDAIFAIYDKAENAINMALAYREAFNKLDFEKFGIKKLNPRIAGNFGEFELIFDPVSGKSNVHGTLVNLTARIEPVTTPGEIFVTKEFKDMSCSSYDKVNNVRFEDMGEIKLPKNAGTLNLYRLCKREETFIKPAGLLISNIDYNIQMPFNSAAKGFSGKSVEKSIEKRLTSNLTGKVSSEEKLKKIAEALKEETPIRKKETNLIKTLINSFKNDRNSLPDDRKSKGLLTENPFLIAGLLFVIALGINFILDTDFMKNLYNLSGYYFNLLIYNINVTIQQAVANDPTVPKIPLIISPITPETINSVNHWLCLRGYLISSFITGSVLTVMQKKKLNPKKIIPAVFITGLFQLALYSVPRSIVLSSVYFLDLNQNFFVCIPVLLAVCVTGLFYGFEYGEQTNKQNR